MSMTEKFFVTRCTPHNKRISKYCSDPKMGVRAYRYSPDDVMLQLWSDKTFTSVIRGGARDRAGTDQCVQQGRGGRAMSNYGKRGGTSKNAGKKAAIYEVDLPDGTTVRKALFDWVATVARQRGETLPALGWMHEGKLRVTVYPRGLPLRELRHLGDIELTAVRMK